MFGFEKIIEFVNGLRQYNTVPQRYPPISFPSNPEKIISIPLISLPWEGVVIHHSFSKDNPDHNDWEGIRLYHMSYRIDGNSVSEAEFNRRKELGDGKKFEPAWREIGYHGGLEQDNGGPVWRWGRPWNMSGAHAGFLGNPYYNDHYLGLCICGNYDLQPPPKEIWNLALKITRQIVKHFNIDKSNVIGHREVYDRVKVPREKTCPGNLFSMDNFRNEL